jgi:hypothetical protein
MSESGALLTPSQRDYLQEKEDKEGANERMTKKRIRDRLYKTLVEDIQILQHSIESDAVPIQYEDLIKDLPQNDRRRSFSKAIVFICQLAAAGDIDVDDLLDDARTEVKEGREKAIREKLRRDKKSVTIGELLEIGSPDEILGEIQADPNPGPSGFDELTEQQDSEN